jgi:hypothetical protein
VKYDGIGLKTVSYEVGLKIWGGNLKLVPDFKTALNRLYGLNP